MDAIILLALILGMKICVNPIARDSVIDKLTSFTWLRLTENGTEPVKK